MGLTKYSLICENGHLFRTGAHYLIIGEWVSFGYGYTILQHGVLSDEEYHQIKTQSLVNVYQDMRNKAVSILPCYHDRYFDRNADKTKLTSYCGCLHRESEVIWGGEVHIK